MPYKKFTQVIKGKKVYCTKNKETGKIVHYSSVKKRKRGMKIREAFAHGWKPTGKKGGKKR